LLENNTEYTFKKLNLITLTKLKMLSNENKRDCIRIIDWMDLIEIFIIEI